MLVAREVEPVSGVTLFVTGGAYQPWAEALLGPTTTRTIETLRADLCVISASGIAGGQCHHPHEDVAAVKAAMMRAAGRSVLLLDHSKLERRALHSFARLDAFDAVVVDSATPVAAQEALSAAGARVEVAASLP
jgi:DeoR/GlpR family transcriptional regulator of sugar metabolism